MSRDTLRRGVVVRSSNDPRSREGIATISLRAIARLPVSNESMSLPEVDNIDEDDIENESPPPIGLPGRRPARRRTRVQRRNTGEVINDETAGGEMVVEYLRSRGRLREEDVEDFLTCRCLRTTSFLHALVKQANALYESHPEWHLTVDERRDVLRRERRAGISETQMDTAARMDATSKDEDTEMENFDVDRPNFNSSESGNARANKDLSGRQRTVL
jgi:hypothetical protein